MPNVDLTPLLRLPHDRNHPIERVVATGQLPPLRGERIADVADNARRAKKSGGHPKTFAFYSADARRKQRNLRLALWDIVHRAVGSPVEEIRIAGRELERRLQSTMVDIDMDTTREYGAAPPSAEDVDDDLTPDNATIIGDGA